MIREREREKNWNMCSLGAHYILFCCSFSLCVRCCLWVIVVEMFLALFIFITMIMCTHTYGAVCVIWTIVLFFMTFFFSGKEKFFFLFVGFSFVFLFTKTTKLFYIFISFFFVVVERRKKKKDTLYYMSSCWCWKKQNAEKSEAFDTFVYIIYKAIRARFFLSFFSFFYFYYYF